MSEQTETPYHSGAYLFGVAMLMAGATFLFVFDWRLASGLVLIRFGRAVAKDQAKKYEAQKKAEKK
jgi:hypothetical protein